MHPAICQTTSLKLRISPPIGDLLPGRGFYQLEEDSLYVQIAPFSNSYRFFSYLESEHVRFDLDREGRLLFVEVNCPRRHWRVVEDMSCPLHPQEADIRWLRFRSQMANTELFTNQSRTALVVRFAPADETRTYRLTESVLLEIGRDSTLAAVWITDIVDDLAGQCIAAYRRKFRPQCEKLPDPVISY